MRGQNPVHGFDAGFAGAGEFTSNIIGQVVGLLIDVLLGNRKHLVEVTLEGSLHPAIALDFGEAGASHAGGSRGAAMALVKSALSDARDLAALLDVLGVGRAAIVGMSIGGVIAQELTRQRPELVAALVLCDTAAKIGTDESWDERIAAVERGGIESVADPILERWFTPEFRSQRVAEFAGFRAMLTRTPKEGYLAACGALKRADLRPYAGAIEAPTLCLVGDQDGSTPVALVRQTAGLIKGSRFEIIEGAGHLSNVEKPAAVARLIAEHVTRTAA